MNIGAWQSPRSCHIVYRGQDGNIDYDNIQALMNLGDSQVSIPNQSLQAATIWHYVRRQVSGCSRESEDSPSCIVMLDNDDEMIGNIPNPPLSLTIQGLSGGRFRLRWRYSTIGEEVSPTGFHIYMDSGSGFDFNAPVATVLYGLGGRGEFQWISGALTNGQLYRFCVRSYQAGEMSYVSPTGYIEGDWDDEWVAFDGASSTSAYISVNSKTWSPFLTLTHPGLYSDRVRFDIGKLLPGDKIDVDVYRDGEWIHVYEGTDFNNHTQTEKAFNNGLVVQERFRYWNDNAMGPPSLQEQIYEVDLFGALITESQNTNFVAAVADSMGPDAITGLRASWEEI